MIIERARRLGRSSGKLKVQSSKLKVRIKEQRPMWAARCVKLSRNGAVVTTGARPSGRRNVRSQPRLQTARTRTTERHLRSQKKVVRKFAHPKPDPHFRGLKDLGENRQRAVASALRRTRASHGRLSHGNGAAEFWAKEWRQRNGDGETNCLHSFASIPLLNPFRRSGFSFNLAKPAQPVADVLGGRREAPWQVEARGIRVSRVRLVTSAATFSHSLEPILT